MARPRIRSAARSTTALTGAFPEREQATGFASQGPHADASGWWGHLRWSWIYQSARKCTRDPQLLADFAHDIALAVVEELHAGSTERQAYNRAESRTRDRALDDRFCGMTGDLRAMRHTTAVGGEVPGNATEAGRSSGWRLTPGDWRALRAFLRRACPDANGKGTSTARRLLEGVLCEGESFTQMVDRLGLTKGAAMAMRSRALLACYAELGVREHRTYGRRQPSLPDASL